MHRRPIRLFAAVAGLGLLVAACSGGGGASGDAESGKQISVNMGDFFFEPTAIDVSEGETVRFLVTNEGAVDHEFRVTNAELISEHLEEDHGDASHEEGASEEEEEGHFIVLEPGQSGVLEVTFAADQAAFTEIACLLPGHYEAGMKGLVRYGA